MVVLIDTNVIIDYFQKRDDYLAAEKIIDDYCTNGKIDGFIAAHSITDIFYILRKDFSVQERRQIILDLLDILEVVDLDKHKIIVALKNNSFSDFEDCLQSESALAVNADYIITRNKKDFADSAVKVVTPSEFLVLV